MKKPDFKLSAEDVELFRNAVKGTTPLRHDKITPQPKKTSPRKISAQEMEKPVPDYIEREYIPAVEADERLLFERPGLQHKTWKKLRKGRFPVEARLDLHGCTVERAGQRLHHFIRSCHDQGKRSVIIVHGRGHRSAGSKPVLKAQVNHWLRNEALVLAFCSAQICDGGTGALYVLLKNRRPE
jgi:DNA-nicking Smr family endonuclease